MRRARLSLACAALLAAVAGGPTVAGAVDPAAPTAPAAGPEAFFDVRAARRAAIERRGGPVTPAPTRAARERLARRLGPAAVLDVDPLTGTLRALQDLDGALSAPAAGDRARIARAFAREHATALGLDAGDVDALEPARRVEGPSGSVQLRFTQAFAGIPAFDSGLRVTVDRAGRVLTLTGAPQPDLRVASTAPRLSGAAALARVMDDVGERRPVRVTDGPRGTRRVTRFGGEDEARLVLFAGGEVRLAWRVTYAAGPAEVYDAVVDAQTGAILRRANLVKREAAADVFELHPGELPGGTARRVDLEARGYLPPGAPTLAGRGAEAYSDVDGDDVAAPSEQVRRTPEGDFVYPFTRFDGSASGCSARAHCTWDHTDPTSWQTNRAQATVQAFYAVNRFADHLRSAPIGFDDASGAFGGDDPVRVETEDGAASAPPYRNNASMYTPPDGSKPRMELHLFGGPADTTRDVDSADDSAVIFHEYAHGLSSRLVTDDDGFQALNSPHAATLGEAWSDWYAEDLLVREGHVADTDAAGEVSPSSYHASRPGVGRSQAIDCPVGAAATPCPGGRTGQAGGYTLGDFGRVVGVPEIHYDGEIWGETLWDLRTALVRLLGPAAGADAAERLVTGGLRLSPPEPSFLDARNAILAADAAAGGRHRDLLWSVFRARGMGFFAAVESNADTAPVEDFSAPPEPGAPRGAVEGRLIDEVSGLPLGGASVGLGGHTATLAARTAADGTYRIADVPAGRYPKLLAGGLAGYSALVERDVGVAGGQATRRDLRLRRNWAGRAAGGRKVSATNEPYDAEAGCGADEAIDERRDTAWLSVNPTTHPSFGPATVVVELPRTIDVRAFGLDPRTGCYAGPSSSTRDFRLETSPDGSDGSWSVALQGSFAAADVGRLNVREPAAAAARAVRFVRLTLLEPFDETRGSGRDFIGFSELEVYGAAPNGLPVGELVATPGRVVPGEAVRFDAGSLRDPDSAITGYDWDFDGDGRVDRTTAEPVTVSAFGAAGRVLPRVFARDFRGGAGTAQATVDVVVPPPPPPPPPAGAVARPSRRPAGPTLTVAARGTRGRIGVRVACSTRCSLSGRLTADRGLARRLRASRTLGRLSVRLPRAGARRAVLAVGARIRARLRRLGVRTVRLSARVTVRDGAGRKRTVTRRVVLRI